MRCTKTKGERVYDACPLPCRTARAAHVATIHACQLRGRLTLTSAYRTPTPSFQRGHRDPWPCCGGDCPWPCIVRCTGSRGTRAGDTSSSSTTGPTTTCRRCARLGWRSERCVVTSTDRGVRRRHRNAFADDTTVAAGTWTVDRERRAADEIERCRRSPACAGLRYNTLVSEGVRTPWVGPHSAPL